MKSKRSSLLIVVTAGLLAVASVASETGAVDATTASMQDPARRAIDVVVATKIEVDRSAAVVWPHVVDSNAWTRLKLIHRDGPAGQTGEIFSIIDPAKPEMVKPIAETLEMVLNHRRSIKIYDEDGPLRGYAIWSLSEARDRTTVTYEVYYETVLPPREVQSVSADRIPSQQRREGENLTKRQMEIDLIALKRIVESKTRVRMAVN